MQTLSKVVALAVLSCLCGLSAATPIPTPTPMDAGEYGYNSGARTSRMSKAEVARYNRRFREKLNHGQGGEYATTAPQRQHQHPTEGSSSGDQYFYHNFINQHPEGIADRSQRGHHGGSSSASLYDNFDAQFGAFNLHEQAPQYSQQHAYPQQYYGESQYYQHPQYDAQNAASISSEAAAGGREESVREEEEEDEGVRYKPWIDYFQGDKLGKIIDSAKRVYNMDDVMAVELLRQLPMSQKWFKLLKSTGKKAFDKNLRDFWASVTDKSLD
ncbi:hypothetical protein CBS101457_003031 [Exobasidium rhododendri]|nr:hypothetical protein CBS101457_003031 [Exobasidium rhododendri]